MIDGLIDSKVISLLYSIKSKLKKKWQELFVFLLLSCFYVYVLIIIFIQDSYGFLRIGCTTTILLLIVLFSLVIIPNLLLSLICAVLYLFGVFLVFQNNIVVCHNPLMTLMLLWLMYMLGRGLFFVYKNTIIRDDNDEDNSDIDLKVIKIPHPLSKEGYCLLSAVEELEQLINDNHRAQDKINLLKIPVPKPVNNNDYTSFINYVKELSELPHSISLLSDDGLPKENNTSLAPFEQFLIAVTKGTHFDKFSDGLSNSLAFLADAKLFIVQNLHEDIIRYKETFINFKEDPLNLETWKHIWDNIVHQFEVSGTSIFTLSGLAMKKTLKEGMKSAAETGGLDVAKGFAMSFFDEKTLGDIDNVKDFAISAAKEFVGGLEPSFDLDVFQDGFDFGGHFPLLKLGMESVNLFEKFEAGDVNMIKASKNTAIRVGGVWGGATIGAVLLAPLFPPFGSIAGGAFGAWIGNKLGNKAITEAIKEKQEQLKEWIEELKTIANEAKETVSTCQKSTTLTIACTAEDMSNNFNKAKELCPVNEKEYYPIYMSVGVMLKDYLESFINYISKTNQVNSTFDIEEMKCYIPTLKQIYSHPVDSVNLMLSAQFHINSKYVEDRYCNYELVINSLIEDTVRSVIILKNLELVWLGHVYKVYSRSVNELLSVTNKKLQELQDIYEKEKKRVETKNQDCIDLNEEIKEDIKAI